MYYPSYRTIPNILDLLEVLVTKSLEKVVVDESLAMTPVLLKTAVVESGIIDPLVDAAVVRR